MFNIGGGEVLVILLIALIVLGPDKLPNAARQAGKYLGDFRRMSSGFQRELKDAMDLGDLGDLMSGKPQSPGGPTAQPAAAAAPTVTPSSDAAPIDTETTPSTASATTDAAVATTNGIATPNGNATPNGSSSAPGRATTAPADPSDATTPDVVRKGMIEVDGPSSSFG
jgi:sec-independent protein translocase protein TatB